MMFVSVDGFFLVICLGIKKGVYFYCAQVIDSLVINVIKLQCGNW